MTTPSDEEMAAVKAQITAQFVSRDVKVAYVMADWSKKTGMPAAEIMAYLGSLSDAELDALVDELATEQAREYCLGTALHARKLCQGSSGVRRRVRFGNGYGDAGALL